MSRKGGEERAPVVKQWGVGGRGWDMMIREEEEERIVHNRDPDTDERCW